MYLTTPSAPITPVFLRAAQAARFVGVSIATFNRMRRDESLSLPEPRLVRPGVQAWLSSELAEWALSRPVASASPKPEAPRKAAPPVVEEEDDTPIETRGGTASGNLKNPGINLSEGVGKAGVTAEKKPVKAKKLKPPTKSKPCGGTLHGRGRLPLDRDGNILGNPIKCVPPTVEGR